LGYKDRFGLQCQGVNVRVIIENSPEEASLRAAEVMAKQIRRKPNCVLGLATGGSPVGVYQELARKYSAGDLDLAQVVTFNLDEYVGLAPDHRQSYRYFMQSNLFDHVNIPPERCHVPDGRALDYDRYCDAYESKIREYGGIDLQLLGIGTDGHIAFNEPGSSLGSRTRLKTLTSETIRDNARFFGSEQAVPRLAVTMGVGTILESRCCLLIAFGDNKADAIAQAIEGPVTAQITASALQLHRDVIVVLDEQAAQRLKRRDYYQEVEEAQLLLESGKVRQLGIGAD
jgi:glucosamine-6-phosphate deaminase